MATESSVVVALREVRRIETDRQRRQASEQAQQQVDEERAWHEARMRATPASGTDYGAHATGYGHGSHGYAAANAQGAWPGVGYEHGRGHGPAVDPYAHMRRTGELAPLEAQGYRPSTGGHAAHARGGWGHSPTGGFDVASAAAYAVQGGQALKPRSSAGPVILTLLVCAVAAGGGYYKLDQDFATTMAAKAAVVSRIELERNGAFEARARAESEARVKLAAMDARVKELERAVASKSAVGAPSSSAAASPAAATPATTTPVIASPVASRASKPAAAKSSKASKASRPSSKRLLASVERPAPKQVVAPAQAAEEKAPERAAMDKETAAAVKRVRAAAKTKDKPSSDDPLGGLRL